MLRFPDFIVTVRNNEYPNRTLLLTVSSRKCTLWLTVSRFHYLRSSESEYPNPTLLLTVSRRKCRMNPHILPYHHNEKMIDYTSHHYLDLLYHPNKLCRYLLRLPTFDSSPKLPFYFTLPTTGLTCPSVIPSSATVLSNAVL